MDFDLSGLKEPMEYKWKVQTVNEYGATFVSHVDARDVQDRLDAVVGPQNWKDEYSVINGGLFCTLYILINGEWIGKTDIGTKSSFEKEKGEASDAFKRAAVKWGIGRFLYRMKPVKTKSVQVKGKWFPAYGDNNNLTRIYDATKYVNQRFPQKQEYKVPDKKVQVVKKQGDQNPAQNQKQEKPAELGYHKTKLTKRQSVEIKECADALQIEVLDFLPVFLRSAGHDMSTITTDEHLRKATYATDSVVAHKVLGGLKSVCTQITDLCAIKSEKFDEFSKGYKDIDVKVLNKMLGDLKAL